MGDMTTRFRSVQPPIFTSENSADPFMEFPSADG
jgi:hypothetical protein